MNCFLYICLAILISTVQSLRSRSRLKLGPDLASSAELANIVSMPSRASPFAIDLDYFGGSSESVRAQGTSDERSNVEPPQVNSADRSKPIIVYISDPKVQQKLKTISVGRGSSSESDGVSYEDLLKFLIQVGARLKEQQEATNPLADQHLNLLDLIRNTRRRTDDAIYESESLDEPVKQAVKFAREASNEPIEIKRGPRKKSVESIYESPRNKKVSIEELSRGMRKRKISNEDLPRMKYGARGGSIGRFPKFEKPAKRISFVRTPKPFIGKAGIYEDK